MRARRVQGYRARSAHLASLTLDPPGRAAAKGWHSVREENGIFPEPP